MNLNQLLAELRRNILRDVSDAVSVDEADLLWSDDALVAYINEGYFRFAQMTEYLQDATTEAVTRIPLVDGQRDYALHPSIIRVLSVELRNTVIPVVSTDTYFGNNADITSYEVMAPRNDRSGIVAAVPDYEVGTLKLVGVPDAKNVGEPLRLRVSRYPLAKATLDAPNEELEFPERFHLDIIEWAAFRALRNHDADAENMAKASAHKTRFMQAVEEVQTEYRARKFSRMTFSPSWRWY